MYEGAKYLLNLDCRYERRRIISDIAKVSFKVELPNSEMKKVTSQETR